MADPMLVNLIKRDLGAWNHYQATRVRKGIYFMYGPDLTGADFSDLDLTGVDFSGCRMVNACFNDSILKASNFRESSVSGANFWHTSLAGADFESAIIADADFGFADLSKSNLQSADASFTTFRQTKLNKAKFSNCQIQGTVFGDCDLSSVNGLEQVKHLGPSHVGLDTIYKSRGRVPTAFLRGCGLPSSLLKSLPSLFSKPGPSHFHSCFISYSTSDERFAKKLHSRMQRASMRVWFAPERIQGGVKVHEQITKAIQAHDKLLIVLSSDSLYSEWVKVELRRAWQEEQRGGKRKLFPIRLVSYEELATFKCIDSETGQDLANELREYFIPDFTEWKKRTRFENSFAKLSEALELRHVIH